MLKEINELAKKFNNSDEVKNELKRIQSVKCRLKKQKAKKSYETEMTKVVKYEQALKEVRDYFEPKKTTVTTMTENDIKVLTYDETIKAIKSIQSKKCNVQYAYENIDDNDEYKNAVAIEKMLLEHKKQVKPLDTDVAIEKSKLKDLVSNLESLNEIDKDYVLEQLKKLI